MPRTDPRRSLTDPPETAKNRSGVQDEPEFGGSFSPLFGNDNQEPGAWPNETTRWRERSRLERARLAEEQPRSEWRSFVPLAIIAVLAILMWAVFI